MIEEELLLGADLVLLHPGVKQRTRWQEIASTDTVEQGLSFSNAENETRSDATYH